MTTHRITLDKAPDYFGNTMRRAIHEGAVKGLLSAAIKIVNEIQTRIIPAMVRQPVDRGIYKAGWRAEQDGDDALVINRVQHAVFIEHGVQAGSVKVGNRLIGALAEWASRKGLVREGQTPRRAAWGIAIGMAAQVNVKRGSQVITRKGGGRGIFGPTGLQVLGKVEPMIPKFVRDEVAREVERALGGK